MPALIAPGTELHPYIAPDGTTQLRCPACSHYIPQVPHEALTIADHRPCTTPIRCACPGGQGTNTAGQRVVCPCRAEFRVQPQGMARFIVIEGRQLPEPKVPEGEGTNTAAPRPKKPHRR